VQVRIIDFDPVRFINFEAEINYPVEEGIIQVLRAQRQRARRFKRFADREFWHASQR
jgi:hypothetical protein